jgi:hypothetical protein
MQFFNIILFLILLYTFYKLFNTYKTEYFYDTLIENNTDNKISSSLVKSTTLPILPKTTIKTITPEQLVRSELGTNKMQVEYSKIYPIGINFDIQFNNYNNLLANSSITLLNEIFINTKYKANENSTIINFNPGLKQVKSLFLKESEILDYGKYIVSLMNSVSTIGNSFLFIKINPILKEQFENQIKINFQIDIKYNYPKSNNEQILLTPKDFNLLVNVVMLFDKNMYNSNKNVYLETLSLIGISNYGFLAGYSK